MTIPMDAQTIFQDAHEMHDAALRQWDSGDWRDAAEKAWCATLRATQAVILAHTGEMPDTTRDTRLGLDRLVDSNERFDTLVGRYHTRQNMLHGSCFYNGIAEPIRTIERRIRETAAYIDDAERLADR